MPKMTSYPIVRLVLVGMVLLGAVRVVSSPAADKDNRKPPAAPPKDESREEELPRRSRPASPPLKDLRLKSGDETAEERIAEALAGDAEVKFVEQPLEDTLHFLKQQHKINLWIDRRALEDEQIKLDQPVTLELAGVSFESVLNLLLEPLDLEWLIQDEVLKITTRKRAAALADTVTLDVQALLDAGHAPDDLIRAIVQCVEPDSWVAAGGKGTITYSGGALVCRQTQRVQSAVVMLLMDLEDLADEQLEDSSDKKAPLVTLKVYHTHEFPADELAKTVRELVAPDAWAAAGIELRAIKGALFVRQTPPVHREIEKLLKQLLSPAGPPAAGGPPAVDPFGHGASRGAPSAPVVRSASRR